jgi:hypothetical protein
MVIVILGIILFALLCVFSVISQCMRNARLAHYRQVQIDIEHNRDMDDTIVLGLPVETERGPTAAGGYTTYVPVVP